MLDRNLNQFKVFDNRTVELVGDLSSADIPVEFAIVSFAGVGRTPGLERDLTAFIGDCRQRGMPFIGYVITRERVGPWWEIRRGCDTRDQLFCGRHQLHRQRNQANPGRCIPSTIPSPV